MTVPRGAPAVLALLLLGAGLTAGWFAAGHPSAPDSGLQQLDLISLAERVDGLDAVDGRPTMVVLTCPQAPPQPRALAPRFGLVVRSDAALARRVALPRAVDCADGYLLLDGSGLVRYRTYDPGWPRHAEEQEILLDAIAGGHAGGHR